MRTDKRPHWLDDDIYKALRESADEQEAFLAAAFAELNDDWLEQALAELNDDWLEQALAELNDDVLDFVTPHKRAAGRHQKAVTRFIGELGG